MRLNQPRDPSLDLDHVAVRGERDLGDRADRPERAAEIAINRGIISGNYRWQVIVPSERSVKGV